MKIIVTNSFAQVEGGKHAQFLVHHALRYLVPNYYQAIKRAGKKWDGYKSMHDRRSKQFPAGLLPVVKQYLDSIRCHYEVVDLRKCPGRPCWPVALNGITLRDYQVEAATKFLNRGQGILKLGTGAGKCLGKGTPVMMFDGRVIPVEEIKVGDLIMGDDSTPRTVLSLARGSEELFKVAPVKGPAYVVNRSHILSLQITSGKEKKTININGARCKWLDKIDISVEDYLKCGKTAKHLLKGYRVPVHFQDKKIEIPPYILGLWLGDGRRNDTTICSMDNEVVAYLKWFCLRTGHKLTKYPEPSLADSYHIGTDPGKKNGLKTLLREHGLLNNKHVPIEYKANAKWVRLEVLAGLIDTDGYLTNKGFDIVQKIKVLAEDILFLVRTIGLAAYCSEKIVNGEIYYRISISGDTDIIPTRVKRRCPTKRLQQKSVLRTGINIESIGVGEYFGFEIDGNKRFLLGDCTVTHNTETSIAITKAISQPTIFLTHRVNLLYQSAERFVERWPECRPRIGIIGDGNFQFNDLTFATVQTLHSAIKKYGKHALDELKRYRLMIVDEAHRIGAEQFHQCAKSLVNAYWRLGLTATPFMSENPADNLHLMGAIGGVIHEVSPSALIEAGVLAKPFFKFHVIDQPVNLSSLSNWRDIYEQGIVKNAFRNGVIAANTAGLVKMGYKPLVIVTEVAHGKILAEMIGVKGVKAKLVTGADDVQRRVHTLKALSDGRLQCIICSNIFDEGVDVQDVSGIVLAAGTKSAPALFQRTGRAIRKKNDGGNAVIVDFIDCQHPTLERHSLQRYKLVRSEPGFSIIP